jgi:hypothetical protein
MWKRDKIGSTLRISPDILPFIHIDGESLSKAIKTLAKEGNSEMNLMNHPYLS